MPCSQETKLVGKLRVGGRGIGVFGIATLEQPEVDHLASVLAADPQSLHSEGKKAADRLLVEAVFGGFTTRNSLRKM
jgi:hypothetical protein